MSQVPFDPVQMSDVSAPPPPPGWPKGVGITSIVWGSLGMLCGVCGVGGILMQSWAFQLAAEKNGPAPDVLRTPPIQAVFAVIGTGFALVLLFGGISTVRRKAVGRMLHIVWAALSLLMSIPSTIVGVQAMLAQAAWKADNATDPWAQQIKPEIGLVILVIMTLLALAWPVFCLFWFGVKGKRPEEGATSLPVI